MRNLFTRAPAVFTGAAALLAGGLMAAPASAQGEAETMMVLGGYTNYTVSLTKHPEGQIAEQDGDMSIFNNTEIFFNGSAETDGGLQVSARVELEGHSENDQIDEHYITVSGGFGSVEIGANDGADERANKGIFYNSSGVDYYYWNTITVPQSGYYWAPGTYSDGMGVTYTTPSLGGASFAIGYKPSRESGARRGVVQFGDENVFTFGAKYEGDMDGISFAGSVGYGTYDIQGDAATPASRATTTITTQGVLGEGSVDVPYNGNPVTHTITTITPAKAATPDETVTKWGVGVNLGFGDTTLYARYDDEESDPDGDKPATEATAVSLAISHVIGPVKLGLGWRQGTVTSPTNGRRMVDSNGAALPAPLTGVDAVAGTSEDASAGEKEQEDTILIGSIDYSLGSGVTLSGYVAWGETEQTGAVHATSSTLLTPTDTTGYYTQDAPLTGPEQDATASESATALGVALNLAF